MTDVFPTALEDGVRVQPTLLTQSWVFYVHLFYYFHNNTNFPKFGHTVI